MQESNSGENWSRTESCSVNPGKVFMTQLKIYQLKIVVITEMWNGTNESILKSKYGWIITMKLLNFSKGNFHLWK